MAISNATKLANRYGLNLTLTNVNDDTDTYTINFANEVSVEITGDAVYATGGQGHKRLVGFQNPLEGTMTISTQILTTDLIKFLTGDDDAEITGTTQKSFEAKLATRATGKYYSVSGSTVRKDPDGTTYAETITAFKAMVRPNYSVSYTGDGDPQSVEIVLELLEDPTNGILKIQYAD